MYSTATNLFWKHFEMIFLNPTFTFEIQIEINMFISQVSHNLQKKILSANSRLYLLSWSNFLEIRTSEMI